MIWLHFQFSTSENFKATIKLCKLDKFLLQFFIEIWFLYYSEKYPLDYLSKTCSSFVKKMYGQFPNSSTYLWMKDRMAYVLDFSFQLPKASLGTLEWKVYNCLRKIVASPRGFERQCWDGLRLGRKSAKWKENKNWPKIETKLWASNRCPVYRKKQENYSMSMKVVCCGCSRVILL